MEDSRLIRALERLGWSHDEYLAPYHFFTTPDGRTVWMESGPDNNVTRWWLEVNGVNMVGFNEAYNAEG